jgi:hypothetical protein
MNYGLEPRYEGASQIVRTMTVDRRWADAGIPMPPPEPAAAGDLVTQRWTCVSLGIPGECSLSLPRLEISRGAERDR